VDNFGHGDRVDRKKIPEKLIGHDMLGALAVEGSFEPIKDIVAEGVQGLIIADNTVIVVVTLKFPIKIVNQEFDRRVHIDPEPRFDDTPLGFQLFETCLTFHAEVTFPALGGDVGESEEVEFASVIGRVSAELNDFTFVFGQL